MANQGNKTTTAQLHGEAGLIYIRYRATIGNKGKGQKKIVGDLPSYSKILTQLKYTKEDGRYYSLLMGREFKPGRWAILLDFDKKGGGPEKRARSS